ncbi:PAS domain S-box protein [Desulfobaculum senezii]
MKRLRHVFVQLGLMACVCVLLGVWSTPALAHFGVVNIGVLSKRGQAGSFARWNLTAAYLSATVPGHVFRIMPLSFGQVRPAVANRDIDFLLCNPALFVELEKTNGISPMLTLNTTRLGVTSSRFGGVAFTLSDRVDISTISDLHGIRFAAVDPSSLGGWLALRRELQSIGIIPAKDLRELTFTGSHDSVVDAVLSGAADAGTVRTGTLERLSAQRGIPPGTFKVLRPIGGHSITFPYEHSTRLYPEWPLSRMPHTPEDLARLVDAALLAMTPDHPAAITAGISGWSVPRNYEPVHDLLRELRVPPYEDYGKLDPAAFFARYWPYILGALLAIIILMGVTLHILWLYSRLKVTETNYRALFESATDMTFVCDGEYIMDANPAACRTLGFTREELLGARMQDIIAEPMHELPCENADAPHTAHTYKTSYRTRDGRTIPVELNTNVIEYMGEEAVFHEARNITSRMQAENALRQSEEKFRAFFEQHSVVMMVADVATGVITEANAAAAEFYGYPLDTLRGMHVTDIDTDDPETIAAAMGEAVNGNKQIFPLAHQLRSGEVRSIELHAVPMIVDGKQTIYAIIIDVTERQRMEQELRSANAFQELMLENGMIGICYVSNTTIQWTNFRFTEITGYTQEEIRHNPDRLFTSPKDFQQFRVDTENTFQREDIYDAIHELNRPDGMRYWCRITGKAIDGAAPLNGTLWLIDDVTEEKIMEDQLRHTNRMQQVLLENDILGIGLVQDATFQWVNTRFAEMVERPEEQLVGAPIDTLFPSQDDFQQLRTRAYEDLARGDTTESIIRMGRGSYDSFWCRLISRFLVPGDASKGAVWMMEDVTERRRMEEELRLMATRDALTGALNRRRFMEKGENEVRRARRYGHALTALMLDLDHFKVINDTYGHHTGDEVLRAVVDACHDTLRDSDVFGRLGGEEFAVILTETTAEAACDVAERLRQRIESISSVSSEGEPLHFTASIGLSTLRDTDTTLEDVLRRADDNLYEAKQQGRNRLVCA